MEIEVGEYVRTDKGYITKMSSEEFIKIMLENKSVFGKALKHSKNIIDLIEVGDYVNGYKVISVDYDVMDDKTECIELDLNNNYQYNFISANQIKTIITREQFESIECKVKVEG